MATTLTSAAARWLGDHHGVATTAELRRVGLGRKAVDRLCAIGVLRRVDRGVYVLATAPQTLEHRCRLLCALYPGGFVTGTTAANPRPAPSSAHVRRSCSSRYGTAFTSDPSRCPLPADHEAPTERPTGSARWHRRGLVGAARVRHRRRHLPLLDHRSMIHQLLDQRLVEPDELGRIGAWLCHPARRGTRTFQVSMLELGHEPQDSHPEVAAARRAVRRGVPVEAQVQVQRSDG